MKNNPCIVVVEDESDILEILTYNLGKEGFEVIGLSSGEEAINTVKSVMPDLVLLDLMLPGMDGLTICRVLKNLDETKKIPVIMLTAKGEESDIVTGLELGADDYIIKPFSPKIVAARIKAVLRRENKENKEDKESGLIKIHNITIYPQRHEVLVGNETAALTLTEFRILLFLVKKPGWVFTRNQIIDSVHGDDYAVTDRSIDFQIVGLRKKLMAEGKRIETVRGIGYRFRTE